MHDDAWMERTRERMNSLLTCYICLLVPFDLQSPGLWDPLLLDPYAVAHADPHALMHREAEEQVQVFAHATGGLVSEGGGGGGTQRVDGVWSTYRARGETKWRIHTRELEGSGGGTK